LDISDCLTSLANLAGYINNLKIKNELWQEELFVAVNVHPVAHKLLSLLRYPVADEADISSSGLIIHEILRLTSLLFISLLKEQYGVFPSGVSENKLRLTRVLTEVAVDWSSFMNLRLWVLTVSALAGEEDRSWYVSEITVTMAFLDATTWDDALRILKDFIWIGEMLDEAADTLAGELADFNMQSPRWRIELP
jgi:hypothetical protein